MSEIPFYFETPVPKYFRENGWFDNENTFKFVTWAFARCSTKHHKVVIDSKEIILEPFEFIAGRLTSPVECFLTEKQFRGQLKTMQDAGLLKKGANSRANRFTTYIWSTERFCKVEGQQKGKQRANSGPTQGHNQEEKNHRIKKDHHPSIPSFEDPKVVAADDGVIDFFSIEKQESKTTVHVTRGIYLSQADLDECIEFCGSLELLIKHMQHILDSPSRKKEITNWPNAVKKWKMPNVVVDRKKDHEAIGRRLEYLYSNPMNAWSLQHCKDPKKDQEGTLFYCNGQGGQTIFVPYVDQEYEKKVQKIILDKQFKKSGT